MKDIKNEDAKEGKPQYFYKNADQGKKFPVTPYVYEWKWAEKDTSGNFHRQSTFTPVAHW